MKRLIFIFLLLPLLTSAQTGVKWDRYFFTGSMKIGGGLNGYANATLAAQDSASYAESCAWLEIGNDTSKRGVMVPRVLRTDSISNPKKGLIVYEHVSGHFKGYNGSSWAVLDSIGGGGIDTSSLSARIDARVKYTDTAAMLAPYLREADTPAMLSPYLRTNVAAATYEATANKATDFSTINNTKFPTTQAVSNYITGLGYQTLLNAGYAITGVGGGLINVDTTKVPNYRQVDSMIDAAPAPVTSVNGYTGAVDVGLDDVLLVDGATTASIAARIFAVNNASNGFVASIRAPNLTAGRSDTLQDKSGTIALTSDISLQTALDNNNSALGDINISGQITADLLAVNNGTHTAFFQNSVATANRVIDAPDQDGTLLVRQQIKGGTATFNGDGVTAIFNIAHGLGTTPTIPLVFAGFNPSNNYWISAISSTNITVRFQAAPGPGTNNVIIYWIAIL